MTPSNRSADKGVSKLSQLLLSVMGGVIMLLVGMFISNPAKSGTIESRGIRNEHAIELLETKKMDKSEFVIWQQSIDNRLEKIELSLVKISDKFDAFKKTSQ